MSLVFQTDFIFEAQTISVTFYFQIPVSVKHFPIFDNMSLIVPAICWPPSGHYLIIINCCLLKYQIWRLMQENMKILDVL